MFKLTKKKTIQQFQQPSFILKFIIIQMTVGSHIISLRIWNDVHKSYNVKLEKAQTKKKSNKSPMSD